MTARETIPVYGYDRGRQEYIFTVSEYLPILIYFSPFEFVAQVPQRLRYCFRFWILAETGYVVLKGRAPFPCILGTPTVELLLL